MRLFKLLRQVPVVLLDFSGDIADGGSESEETACIGLSLVTVLIYSSRAVTLTIEQGCNDRGGSKSYRDTETIAVAAGTCEKRQIDIAGKFVKATVANASGNTAAVECFVTCRGAE